MEKTATIKSNYRNKLSSFDSTNLMYGKLPPQATPLEEAILGAMMLEKNATVVGLEILKADCFYNENNKLIFRAIANLADKKIMVDILTVSEELKAMESLDQIGGSYYLATLTENVSATAHIEYWCKIVLEKFVQREMIRISGEVINEAYQSDVNVLDLINSAESKLFAITNYFIKNNYQSVSEALGSVMERIEKLKKNEGGISGITSGFVNVDLVTNGWQNTDLIVLAARPGAGKTAMALNLIRNAALNPTHPIPVAFFSLEMGIDQIVQRLLSIQSGVDLKNIKNGRLSESEFQTLITKGCESFANAPIYIDDTGAINIFELRSKCKKLVAHHNVGLIIIDYLQLMSGTSDNKSFNREQEISKISRDLKALAKELHIPIIALSQLNRKAEGRKDFIPMLSDLRESGAIEQDADMVVFLHRPDYYNQEINEQGENIKGLTNFIIAKHRNGELTTLNLRANLDTQTFTLWDDMNSFKPHYPSNNGVGTITTVKRGSKMNHEDVNDDAPPF